MSNHRYPSTHYLHGLNDYVTEKAKSVESFIDRFATLCEKAPAPSEQGELNAGTVCLSLAELVALHQMLFRNEAKWSKEKEFAALLPFSDLSGSSASKELLDAHFLVRSELRVSSFS